MSREQWEAIYREAWSLYYTPKHMETLLRRAVATGVPVASLIKVLVNFATTTQLEHVHPLQGGILRLKHPSERRPGLPRESAFIFWPRFVWETLIKHGVIVATITRLLLLKFVITRDAPLECTRTPRSNRLVTTRRRRSIYSPTRLARMPPSRISRRSPG